MKTLVRKLLIVSVIILVSSYIQAQDKVSVVEFTGDQTEVLTATSANLEVSGTLSSGETIKIECAQGMCSIKIDYKGRSVEAPIGERVTVAKVIEYDFGADEDKEIIVVNDYKGTSVIYVFAYARGIIQKLFEKEIFNNRTVIKDQYIELYSPGGLDTVWNYHQGMFWVMKLVEF